MLTRNAEYLLSSRYCLPGEQPLDVYKRVAQFLGQGDERFSNDLYKAMEEGKFLPNSPCLFNAGTKDGNLHACFVVPVEDDLSSIFYAVTAMGRIFKSGGGVGMNFSKLRERDSNLSGGGKSSGAISFMSIFNDVVEVVKQGGKRRGALMGILNYDHLEILDFVKVKLEGRLQNFNLSVMVDDDFMKKAFNNGDVVLKSRVSDFSVTLKAKNIFELLVFAAWCNGDPALLFFDRINKDNPLYPDIIIDTTNPCSEASIPHWCACCLGSVNISKFVKGDDFDFNEFYNTCLLGMKTLTKMNELSIPPLKEVRVAMEKYNPVGLGIMGFADCLIKLGIYYDSDDCLDFIDQVGEVYKKASLDYNPDKFYFYRRIIAPTGSLSILADCSSGIEPVYDIVFERSLTIGKIEETRDLYLSKYARTAKQVSPEWHVNVLAQWQKWVDGGISKTVNLPFTASVEDVKNTYKLAWEKGCKGITIYRDRSKKEQVLYSKTNVFYKCSDEFCHL